MTAGPEGFPPIVDAAWLAARRGSVVVADVRWYLDGRLGRAAYESGHIPGAVWVDLDRWLAGPPGGGRGRHPLPAPETFASGMAAAGIGDGDTVVAYDDAAGMSAGRLVWLLRVLGCRAALLDGGLATWEGPLEKGGVTRPPAVFPARPWPTDRFATADEIRAAPGVLLDARAPERYRGDVEPVDPRPGHIPGAVNVPFAGNLDDRGRFRPAAELRARYDAAGATAGGDTVVYCGSGVSACHDLLAMEAAGLGAGRLYAGSWSEWVSDPARPAVTGPEKGST